MRAPAGYEEPVIELQRGDRVHPYSGDVTEEVNVRHGEDHRADEVAILAVAIEWAGSALWIGFTAIMDARGFQEIETLKNGVSATIRAVRPDDKARITEAFGQLDPESIYTRFFRAKGALSDQELKAATEVDFENIVALVVTVESGGKETIIGGGRYAAFDVSGVRSAEIAFLVEEDFHGVGIAGRVLKHLARIAREKGVSRFEAEVLPQNKSMLAVFARSGLPMTLTQAEGVTHVTLSLTDQH